MLVQRLVHTAACCAMVAALLPVARPASAQQDARQYVVDVATDISLGELDTDLEREAACNDALQNKNCTLRQAIEKANTDNQPSLITFNIPAEADPEYAFTPGPSSLGYWTIRPGSRLPPLTREGNTTISGVGNIANGAPQIVIDGTDVPATEGVGFTITSSNNRIQGLSIVGFRSGNAATGVGIILNTPTSTQNTVTGCYIGVLPFSTTPKGNELAGILITQSANNNTIGGPRLFEDRNFISGNGRGNETDAGIIINSTRDTTPVTNSVQNNYIGYVQSGTDFVTVGNRGNGVLVSGSRGNTIGANGLRNYIAANTLDGIQVTGTTAQENTIAGNYIGVYVNGGLAGNAAITPANGRHGISFTGQALNNTVTSLNGNPNIISNNTGYGVFVAGAGSVQNKIYGSYIGLAGDGRTALGNRLGGVRVEDGPNGTIIGGVGAGQQNTISGNIGYGISSARNGSGEQMSSMRVVSNTIGLSANGTQIVSNTLGGVFISTRNNDVRIGGASAAEGNIIAGNGGAQVRIDGTNIDAVTVAGNTIGLRRTTVGGPLNTIVPTNGDAVAVGGDSDTIVIGGTAAAARNVIGGATGNGIAIRGSSVNGIRVLYNAIGTLPGSSAFSTLFANGGAGVLVENGPTATQVMTNTIGGNVDGVRVVGNTQNVRIQSNRISRNTGKGINLEGTTVGGATTTNPNHDIDPPIASSLRLNQARRLTGRVVTGAGNPAACQTCTLQVFAADPDLLDGQGRDLLLTAPIEASGYFTVTLPVFPRQIALTATDGNGNTSEFAAFETRFGIEIQPRALSQTDVAPGDRIVYTHRVTNTGTIDLNDLSLLAKSTLGWTTSVSPTGTIALARGEGRTIQLTVNVPRGAPAGTTERTGLTVRSTQAVTATDTVTDTTIVGVRSVITLTPATQNGTSLPNTTLPYQLTVENSGNITGTVSLSAVTDRGWTTTITPTQITLGPGQRRNVTVQVSIPANTAAQTRGVTTITMNQTAPVAGQQQAQIITTASLSAQAIITPNREAQAAAGETITLEHTVQNTGNGQIRLRLIGGSSLGSIVNFRSAQGNATLGPDNTFTLNTQNEVFTFLVDVTVTNRALAGNRDTVSISLLRADTGATIGGVTDTILVVRNAPSLFLPIIQR